MLRIAWYVINVFVWTTSLGAIVFVAALFKVPYRPWGIYDRCQRLWGRILLWTSGVPVRVVGGEQLSLAEPHVLIVNHASFFDVLVLAAYLPLPVKYVARKELFSIPIFGQALWAMGHVKLDRENLQQAFEAYATAARIIRERKLHVVVFPEGTRTRTGQLQPFKKGPFVFAIQVGAPIVPIYLSGTFGILPKGAVRLRPHPVTIAVGEPLSPAGLTYEDRDTLAKRAEHAVRALQARVEGPSISG